MHMKYIVGYWGDRQNPVGYSSGSAGGSVLGDAVHDPPTSKELCEPSPSLTGPPEPPPKEPAQQLPESALSASALESEMKARMDKHAKALEKAMTDDFLEMKRKAEAELETEMEQKRMKRMQELDEEMEEKKRMKEAALESMEMQLQSRMQLVADEQMLLDDLKEKSKNMQRKIEEEASRMTTASAQKTTEDPKTAMKERLKEKLQEKAALATPPPSGAVQKSPPSADSVPAAPESAKGTPPNTAIVPMTDMRFTSSTHPAAWQFLYRLTKREDQCEKEIYDAWHAGAKTVLMELSIMLYNLPLQFHYRLYQDGPSKNLVGIVIGCIILHQVAQSVITYFVTLSAAATVLLTTFPRTRQ